MIYFLKWISAIAGYSYRVDWIKVLESKESFVRNTSELEGCSCLTLFAFPEAGGDDVKQM